MTVLDKSELNEIKELIEKRLKDKTGVDFVANPTEEYFSFQFSVDLIFRRISPCFTSSNWSNENFNSHLERDIDLVLCQLIFELERTLNQIKDTYENQIKDNYDNN
jgi:hypothetical protein